jgi:hypothetical protein
MIAAPEFLGLSKAYGSVAYVRFGSFPACRGGYWIHPGNLLSLVDWAIFAKSGP